jgi:drug/metabolite transporter (DMT)-like permease
VTNTARERSPWVPLVALVFLALIWGYNWVVMKVAVRDCDPFVFAAIRVFAGAVLLFVVVVLRRGFLRPQVFWWTAVYGFFQTSMTGLMVWAIYLGSAGKVSVLNYTMPFWLLMLAWPVLGERIRGAQWVAVALALAGLILILSPWNLRGTGASLLAIGGGISWAIASVLIKIIRARHHVEILSFTAWQALLGSLPLILAALLVADHGPAWTGSFIAALSYNIVGSSVIGLLLWLYILNSLPAGTAGIDSLAIPVVGVLSAWIQLGERPSAWEAAGMACIVAGLAVLSGWGVWLSRRERQDAEAHG